MTENFIQDGYGIVAFVPIKFILQLNDSKINKENLMVDSIKESFLKIFNNETCGVCLPQWVNIELYKLCPIIVHAPNKYIKEDITEPSDIFIREYIKSSMVDFHRKRYMILPNICQIDKLKGE